MHVSAGRDRQWIRWVWVLLVVGSVAGAEGPTLGSASPRPVRPGECNTPRKMFEVFRSVMDEVEYGNDRDIDKAYGILEMPEHLSTPEVENFRYHVARKLHAILDDLQYVNRDIPALVAGKETVVKLGHGKNMVSFQLRRGPDGNWRFASETLNDPELEKQYQEISDRHLKFTRADMDGDTYVSSLRSPSQSMRTFLCGMYGRNGLTIYDALTAMDLSEIDKNVRATAGRTRAVQLIRILNRRRKINLSALSSDPEYPHAHVFLRVPGVGRVVMAVVEDPRTHLKAWKFTSKTIESIPALYAVFRDRPLAPGVIPVDQYLPFDILVADYIHSHQPALDRMVVGLPLWKWVGAGLVVFLGLLGWVVLRRLLCLLMVRGGARAEGRRNRKMEFAFILPMQLAFFVWFCYVALDLLSMPARLLAFLEFARDIIVIVAVTWLLCLATNFLVRLLERRGQPKRVGENLLLPLIGRLVKIIIVIFALFRLAEQCGQDSTRVLAALGIGGVALALAGKDTVENVFGSIMILIERPFRLGDWIITENIEGRVEHVGMRSTRVRTFYNSLITVPNSQFITSPVDNMGRRQFRRLKVMISIAYDTPPEKIVAFTEGIQELVRKHPLTRKDFYHVRLHDLGAASLNILLYVFFVTQEYGEELEGREQLFLDILRLAKELKVEFAFPTQTLNLRQEEAPQHEPMESVSVACREGVAMAQQILGTRQLRPHHEMASSPIAEPPPDEEIIEPIDSPQENPATAIMDKT